MSNIKLRLKKNDKVIVIAGKDKGKQGIVLKVIKQLSETERAFLNIWAIFAKKIVNRLNKCKRRS